MQSSSLTIGPPRDSLYLPFNTYCMFIILGTVHSPGDPDFHFLLNSFWVQTFYKTFYYIGLLVVMQSCSRCMSKKVFYLVFDMCFSWVEFWVNYISLSTLRCGGTVLWLTLFHVTNLRSFSFCVLLFLFFLLVTFLWLIILNNELWFAFCFSCHISCAWINWAWINCNYFTILRWN